MPAISAMPSPCSVNFTQAVRTVRKFVLTTLKCNLRKLSAVGWKFPVLYHNLFCPLRMGCDVKCNGCGVFIPTDSFGLFCLRKAPCNPCVSFPVLWKRNLKYKWQHKFLSIFFTRRRKIINPYVRTNCNLSFVSPILMHAYKQCIQGCS